MNLPALFPCTYQASFVFLNIFYLRKSETTTSRFYYDFKPLLNVLVGMANEALLKKIKLEVNTEWIEVGQDAKNFHFCAQTRPMQILVYFFQWIVVKGEACPMRLPHGGMDRSHALCRADGSILTTDLPLQHGRWAGHMNQECIYRHTYAEGKG